MTLTSFIREQYRERYRARFKYKRPKKHHIHCVAIDMMQYVKGVLPTEILSVEHLISYLLYQITRHYNDGVQCVIACFDRDSPSVKKAVDHIKRKDWRCRKCKLSTSKYAEDCARNCRGRKPLKPKKGPHLSMDNSQPLPDWQKFSLITQNLRNELYPRLMNAMLTFAPPAGCMLLLHGLPTQLKTMRKFHSVINGGTDAFVHSDQFDNVLVPWNLASLKSDLKYATQNDDLLWYRTVLIENVAPCAQFPYGYIRREPVPEMQNQIQEADHAIFYYSQFYPNWNHMSIINDGDAISIGLFRVIENLSNGQPLHRHYLAMPYKKGDAKFKSQDSKPVWEYINLNKLHWDIEADSAFRNAKVASPVATLVCLTILSGTDFFQDFCPGIGFATKWNENEEKRAKQTRGIWDTFFAHIDLFSHMVQWNIYEQRPDIKAKRRIVIDEELFALFVNYCYLEKYGSRVKNPKKHDEISIDEVRVYCSKRLKNSRHHVPTEIEIRATCRRLLWNMLYWVNGFRNIDVDPAEKHQELSYFGFEMAENGLLQLTNTVCASQKPVDEAYKRHFHKRNQKEASLKRPLQIPAKRRASALEKIKGKL